MKIALNMRKAIPEETIQKLRKNIQKDITSALKKGVTTPTPFELGKTYLIRTVTMIDVGKVKAITGNFIILENVSWIGDTGRFNECLTRNDVFIEVEPFKEDVFLNVNSIVDATLWPYTLPTIPK